MNATPQPGAPDASADGTETPPWHVLPSAEVAHRLAVDPDHGLDEPEARERLARVGPNEIRTRGTRPPWRLLLAQFADFMILVLLAAAAVSGAVGDLMDALAILVIVVLNALVGALQEYRAERAVAALRRLAAPHARVRREGRARTVAARSLVPGDVVLLEAGDIVPADLRLVAVSSLQVDESPLTGESAPVDKDAGVVPRADAPLADRHGMAWRDTRVTRGRGCGIAVATGPRAQTGRIAGMLEQAGPARTPLQRRLAAFGRRLALAVLGICAALFATGLLRGQPPVLMFLTAVSLAVAAIPEALPAVVTVSLALGARRMSRRKALIRRLPAVESLGSVTCICSDKTGTLTENRMRVERVWMAGTERETVPAPGGDGPAGEWLGPAMALCNDLGPDGDDESAGGDPTERALLRAAAAAGWDLAALARRLPRAGEAAFDTVRKRMSTLHRDGDGRVLFTKGAPESVLGACDAVAGLDSPDALEQARHRAEALASRGYRVLAVAWRRLAAGTPDGDARALEQSLTLLGLVALLDPPREGAVEAVAECRSAGIVPVMITGDHPGTALAIARRLGIGDDSRVVTTGRRVSALSDEELAAAARRLRVYARMSPEEKIRIVDALERDGELVAMTGDGINDAPALRRAVIGVAMGRRGTEVAREAADMVLLDDDFSTIVAAVREGRRIFDNIRKFIRYTMASNAGEILTLFLAPFFGLPIPLLPLQILWVNLVTDGLPGLALAGERAERGLMRRPPRPPGESVFARGTWQHILWAGSLMAGLSLLSQAWALAAGAHWRTVVFTVLTFCQLAHVLAIRSERDSLFVQGPNPALFAAVAATVGLQLLVIYLPALNVVFRTAPLGPAELAVCLGLPLAVLAAVELEKYLVRRFGLYAAPAQPDSRAGEGRGSRP
ncbi:MAG TPA: cation-translocating P-type ATPase [Gammaproteobacteria bacterium]|nr:cation-translocating P-type ATPase [Gammaproteobacteria bacterium]